MKKKIQSKIGLMLATLLLFQQPMSAKFDDFFSNNSNVEEIGDQTISLDFDEDEEEFEDKKKLGLVSNLVNEISKIRGGTGEILSLSSYEECGIILPSLLLIDNLKSGIRNCSYEKNPFSASNLDKAAGAAGNSTNLEKLKWIAEHLYEKNSIKYGIGVDMLARAQFPLYFFEKSKLLNLFVSTDRSNLQKNMEHSSTVYKTKRRAICADSAKIFYLWAKQNNLDRIMVIEGYHCYTMIKIDGSWYRPETLDKDSDKFPRLQKLTGPENPRSASDRKILLIDLNKELKEQTWEEIKVWDLNMHSLPTWNEILEVTKDPKKAGKYQDTQIIGTKDLRWEIGMFY